MVIKVKALKQLFLMGKSFNLITMSNNTLWGPAMGTMGRRGGRGVGCRLFENFSFSSVCHKLEWKNGNYQHGCVKIFLMPNRGVIDCFFSFSVVFVVVAIDTNGNCFSLFSAFWVSVFVAHFSWFSIENRPGKKLHLSW
jgi:hypothetical protein